MVKWQEFFYKKKKIKLNKGEFSLFQKVRYSGKYKQEIEERISREKERLRSYFTKQELCSKTKFLDALEREFSKKDKRGISTGLPLKNRPEMMFRILKLKEEFIEEVWDYRLKKEKWSVNVKRDNLGRFQKVTRIKQLLVEENTDSSRMAYSEKSGGGGEISEEGETSTYSV